MEASIWGLVGGKKEGKRNSGLGLLSITCFDVFPTFSSAREVARNRRVQGGTSVSASSQVQVHLLMGGEEGAARLVPVTWG